MLANNKIKRKTDRVKLVEFISSMRPYTITNGMHTSVVVSIAITSALASGPVGFALKTWFGEFPAIVKIEDDSLLGEYYSAKKRTGSLEVTRAN